MTLVTSMPVAATARLVGEHDADLWVLWERRVARSGLAGSGREAPRVRSSAQGRRSSNGGHFCCGDGSEESVRASQQSHPRVLTSLEASSRRG